jgi:predicted PurR-regulated permease PerM
MTDAIRAIRPWLTFIGCVVVVGILYWGQAVIVPLAFSLLMAFLLTPVVSWLQRWIGRVASVIAVVALAFAVLGAMGWTATQQLGGLIQELPTYRQNIRQKIRDVRGAAGAAPVETLQKTVEEIQKEIQPGEPAPSARALIVRDEQVSGLWGYTAAIGPWLAPLATAGLIVALVIFILLEREELRNRMIRLFGHGQLVVTTRAFDEAGQRVSRYLLVQSLVNLVYGVGVGTGLFFIGVPYPVLWGALAAALRFIPYVGPIVASVAPVLVALAALEGWVRPLWVVGLFVALELFTNLVLETALYAGTAGVSQVALLVAVAFWSWLWGPLGLLMATPLTVCLTVIGKYVPGLEWISTLISDQPVLAPEVSYYQRLIAGDKAEAIDIIETYVEEHPRESLYDAIMLPALSYAERDRIQERLSPEEEREVIDATRELVADSPGRPEIDSDVEPNLPRKEIPILGVAAHGDGDVVALHMFCDLLAATPYELELKPEILLTSEVLEAMASGSYRAVCIADLPPSAPSKSRYLVKRLRALDPELPILVGRWAPHELADESDGLLASDGATHVAATLIETRDYLETLAPVLVAKADRAAPA